MKYCKLLVSFISVLSFFLYSCSNEPNNSQISITYLVDSLVNSTNKIDSQTISEYKNLQTKVTDTLLKEKALIGIQYVEKIKTITNEMRNSIDLSFKSISKSELEEVKSSLGTKLEKYITVIFQINPEIWMAYRKVFPQLIDVNYFNEFDTLDKASLFKAKIYNSISTIENKAV